VRLTGSDKPWRLRPDGRNYRLYDGTGNIQVTTQPGPERDECDPLISGSSTSVLKVVDSFIQITPPRVENGVQRPGKAEVIVAYTLSPSGETETSMAMVNYACVPGDVSPLPFWWSSYMTGREENGGDINLLKDWEFVGREGIVARKILRSSCLGGCDEERSVFTLREVQPQ
jgi:hypothetical protein